MYRVPQPTALRLQDAGQGSSTIREFPRVSLPTSVIAPPTLLLLAYTCVQECASEVGRKQAVNNGQFAREAPQGFSNLTVARARSWRVRRFRRAGAR